MNLQPSIQNDVVSIQPLVDTDLETLYAIANDPLLWEQHPNPLRYQRPVFETFFQGAMESGSAFLVKDAVTGEAIGSSRFYEWNAVEKSIAIGYTFIARSRWGTPTNRALKTLMLDYIFHEVDRVIFHVGAVNIRSQKAMEKLGAIKFKEEEMQYYGEANRLNLFYEITKEQWHNRSTT